MKRFISILLALLLVVPVSTFAVEDAADTTTPNNQTVDESNTTESEDTEEVSKVIRLGGKDRYETSLRIASELYETETKVAILAQGTVYADALGASSLTKLNNAPILLVKYDEIPEATLKRLKELKVTDIYLIGGKQTISEAVEEKLTDMDYEVSRLYGENRYETAREIAKEVYKQNKYEHLYIADGRNFPDALSAGAPAALHSEPILFSADTLPDASKDWDGFYLMKKMSVVGGPNSVPPAVMKDLAGPTRYSGDNRVLTSLDVAEKLYTNPKTVVIANGGDYPDALVGSALAAAHQAPILLVERELSEDVKDYLENNQYLENIYILGGTNSIPVEVEEELVEITNDKTENKAPVIEAKGEVVLTEGDAVDFLKDVKVSDDRGEEIEVTIKEKNAEEMIETPGRYTITLVAEDSLGAKTEFEVTYIVLEEKGLDLEANNEVDDAKQVFLTALNDERNDAGLQDGELAKNRLVTIAQELADEWAVSEDGTFPEIPNDSGILVAKGTSTFRTAENAVKDLLSNEETLKALIPAYADETNKTTVVYGVGIAKEKDTNHYFWVVVVSDRKTDALDRDEKNYKLEFLLKDGVTKNDENEIEVTLEEDIKSTDLFEVKETNNESTTVLSVREVEVGKVRTVDGKDYLDIVAFSTKEEEKFIVTLGVEDLFGDIQTKDFTIVIVKSVEY